MTESPSEKLKPTSEVDRTGRTLDIEQRFMAHVSPEPNSGCWLWAGPDGPKGYGTFHFRGSAMRAHRAAYQIWTGNPVGFICHKCDVRACVNPQHLYLGTHMDNMRDMRVRNRVATGDRNGAHTHPHRRPRGEVSGQSKLTLQSVQAIRNDTRNFTEIAKAYGVARSTIGRIKNNLLWRNEFSQ